MVSFSGFCAFVIATILFTKGAQAAKPNVVFVLTDDQGATLGTMGVMDNLKSIILDKGVYFNNSFVATPICCVSRSSLLVGRYPHNTKCLSNNDGCWSGE